MYTELSELHCSPPIPPFQILILCQKKMKFLSMLLFQLVLKHKSKKDKMFKNETTNTSWLNITQI